MKKLESPYTVHLLDVLTDLEKNYFFLVMNFEENGKIEAFISDNPNISRASPEEVITELQKILQSLPPPLQSE